MNVTIQGGARPEEVAAVLAVLLRPRTGAPATGIAAWRAGRHRALRPSVTPSPRRNRG
jgi:hypothetical protein